MYMEENLKEQLIEKLEKEQMEFLNSIREQGVDCAINNAYQIMTRQEIIDYLSYSEIDSKDIKALLNTENVLGIFYDEWLDFDGNFYEQLEYPIQDRLESISNDFYSRDDIEVEDEENISKSQNKARESR